MGGGGHCSVCGELVGSKRSIPAPGGRVVCETCVERAREVLTNRRAREQRAVVEAEKQRQLVEAEGDNRLVLELQADEWLRAASHSCPSCGRFMALADCACRSCGFGQDAVGGPGAKRGPRRGMGWRGPRWASREGSRGVLGARLAGEGSGPVDDVLSQVHPLLPMGVPVGLVVLAMVGLVASIWIDWTWTASVMGLFVLGIGAFAGSVLLMFRERPKEGPIISALGVAAGVAAVVAGRDQRAGVAIACVFGASVVLGVVWYRCQRAGLDNVLVRLWIGLASAGLIAGCVMLVRTEV